MSLSGGTRVREFYARLGITLLRSAGSEAPARCFASSDAHRRGDRHPSMSVNLISGAFYCHACGTRGGAYDAALVRGHTPRSAMDLLVAHGLAEPRERSRHGNGPTGRVAAPRPSAAAPAANRTLIAVTDEDVAQWAAALASDAPLLERLRVQRGISSEVLARFAVGFDGKRITMPTRNAEGLLIGVVRWKPFDRGNVPKMLALPGSQRDLFPPPETLPPGVVVLCEGEPDALAAHSAGIPAVAIPGAASWRPDWATRFAARTVVIVFDCDAEGRAAARTAEDDLRGAGAHVLIADLEPKRVDGYDLTDRLLARFSGRNQ